MDFASEENRQRCRELKGAILRIDAQLHDGTVDYAVSCERLPSHFEDLALVAFIVKHLDPLMPMLPIPPGLRFTWKGDVADIAGKCPLWPSALGRMIYDALDKALTIEVNKRKHAAAPSGAETAQAGLELAGAGLDLALKKLRVASELIAALRTDLLAILKGDRPLTPTTIDLLAQWDKLKGK